MFSIFSAKPKDRRLPSWAKFFNSNEYNLFMDLIEKYFVRKKISFQIMEDSLTVAKDVFGYSTLGLVNIGQKCKLDNKRRWKRTIAEHFDSMIEANQFNIGLMKIINDFEQVKKYIGVRIYSIGYFESIDKDNIFKETLLNKPVSDDLVASLVFDLPHSVENINFPTSSKWNKPIDELFNIGLANIKRNYSLKIVQHKLGEFKIWFVHGDHFFATNIILEKSELDKYMGSKGALIGIPNRHSVLIYPIENFEVANVIQTIIQVTRGLYNDGPGSISSKLYWHDGTKMIDLPYELNNGKLNFFPPDRFVTMLNTLKEND